jgi:ABC-type lipoprotein release transport system permease subunit
VTGIFNSGHYDFDANYIFCHVETGAVLYNLGAGVHGIAVFADDGMQARELRNTILETFGGKRVDLAAAIHPVWQKFRFFAIIAVWVSALIAVGGFCRGRRAIALVLLGAGLLTTLLATITLYGPPNYLVDDSDVAGLTWMELHGALLNAVAMERQMMYFLMLFMLVLAGFCIMTTMITSVYQKRSEIGLLKAVGATEWQISKIFLVQGAIVGLLGIALGLSSGFLIVEFRNGILGFLGDKLGLQMLSEEVYKFEGLPATRTWSDTLSIAFGAIVACVCASIIPAFIASRMEPAEALRTD